MSQQEAILALMQGKYAQIRDIETQHSIFGHEGDYRPRIEYYHDAVRALGGDYQDGLSKDSRLSVERLAYDIEMLRLITAKPLVAGRGQQHYSTSDALSTMSEASGDSMPDRTLRQQLGALYKDYTVFFAALMAEKADQNAQARQEEADTLIEDCHMLENLLTQLSDGAMDIASVIKAASLIEHDGLRRKVLALLNKGKPKRGDLDSAANSVKDARHQVQQEAQAIDACGLRVASSRLAIYESSRDLVKQLASEGLNIAGRFTGQAVGQSQGRGGGRGY